MPTVWCNTNADEMAQFYLAASPGARLDNHVLYPEEGLLDVQ
ncbi:hypothetical protein [uncultured Corynebacterium sp.]|nr:hypothetical protein [uncultured Corynebacterium sp.]